jgi:hypothetical protein
MNGMQKLWVPVLVAVVAGCDTGPTAPVGHEAELGLVSGVEVSLPEASGRPGADERDREKLAARWINHAGILFRRATDLAGPDPDPRIAAWLRAADQMLDQAVRSFEAGDFHAAIGQAQASAAKSRQVIRALSGGERPDRERERRDRDREA